MPYQNAPFSKSFTIFVGDKLHLNKNKQNSVNCAK